MEVTAIRQQAKNTARYSVFVDGRYAFSLSEAALIESKLVKGQAMSARQIREFKKLSGEDKLYNQTLRYVAIRARSHWEVKQYLARKNASPPLIEKILNKLSDIEMVDDKKFAKAFVNDRRLLHPASRLKILMQLRQKRVADNISEEALGQDIANEQAALNSVIERKRRQTKYQDELKLMQYLSRQGFNYEDIKSALKTKN